MNGNEEPVTPMTDGQFERLVDGEMANAERRALLSRLDDEPDGWRRCALAFLEAQCCKEALGLLGYGEGRKQIEAMEPVASPAAGAEARVGLWRHSPWARRVANVLAMAASFMLALGLGWWARSVRINALPDQPTATQLARDGSKGNAAGAPLANHDSFLGPTAPGASPSNGSPWRMVTLTLPGEGPGQPQAIRVPAVERETIDGAWLNGLPSLPPDVLQALQSTGHQVQQSRQLVPVPLDDGRRLVVPVDQIEVRETGGGYQ